MSKRSSANLDADSRHPAPSRQPIIIIADETLSVQAQLSNTLSADVSLISAINQDQLEYWLEDQEEQPDLLLLDQHFVGQQVGLFCKNWQLNPNTRDIDLMVMGPDDDEFEVQALAAGALDYLRKPLNSKICKLRIEKCLQQRVTFQELERLSITDGLTKLANRRYFDD
ncbi:MAG: hypothetical protein P1U57_13160, partial [Oleibacter sp.]|nr:hypothetical protein [Thalassolituus sp.]